MGQIVRHMSENLPIMGILYNTSVILHGNRLLNIKGGGGGAWNAHEWDVRN